MSIQEFCRKLWNIKIEGALRDIHRLEKGTPLLLRFQPGRFIFLIPKAESGLFIGDCSGSQETEFRSQNGNTGDVDEWHRLLEKVSKLLETYSRAILNSDS